MQKFTYLESMQVCLFILEINTISLCIYKVLKYFCMNIKNEEYIFTIVLTIFLDAFL